MEQLFICRTLDDLQGIAEKMLELFPKDRIFAFEGSMGAGKTTFIKVLCKNLEVLNEVVSPTFAIINEYHSNKVGPIYHFDFYRINNIEEVMDIGYEDYLYSGNYCLMEWPEKIEKLLPENIVYVTIQNLDDRSRSIHVKKK
ncbi:MAG: tRNA (adenosine(37)-N6)-threonylcarbamoyltransferase complex ATPase subunit type 1 TsaE [Bacteroidetes bacterium]|nr:tRNA (adenosine(37)-N6)-threonylcarbamoyltransferase complex ATPase subunit type 1 TsaE [Bacteroidota bacterium]